MPVYKFSATFYLRILTQANRNLNLKASKCVIITTIFVLEDLSGIPFFKHTHKKQLYHPCHNIRQEPIFIYGLGF
jgi:hypothetical protein